MSDVAVTTTTLTGEAVSADILTNAEGATQVTANNVAVITVNPTDRLVITIYGSGGAATATVAAGTDPPAKRAALGSLALTIPASDCVLYFADGARHLTSGTIRITITTNTCQVGAYLLPKTF